MAEVTPPLPLSEEDERGRFDCGRDSLNAWFRRHAWHNHASREVGSFGVLTHPIDEGVRQFYYRWGFQDVPFDPRRSMIVRMIDLEKSGVAA